MKQSIALMLQLVKDFRAQEAAYLSPKYQESQVRQDFIDKFFTALGWDVTHERQKNPYEQEVKIENRVRTEGSQRFADYAFFVAPNYRDVKFFVEAKKPAHNLHNADYYHQAIRYGWNQKTPIAVLTDFEEFHILDCRYKPDIKTALNRKLDVYKYNDYGNEEIFSKIFYLFGRDAVANGSLDKYAETLQKPKGKAAKKGMQSGRFQQVDQAFLELLDGYRDTLAHSFKNRNPRLDGEALTEAVQRTIDRLVFIRFLEDKGIEEKMIVGLESKPSSWKSFLALCHSLEPKYNGLVFKQHPVIDGETFSPPDHETFGDICKELADPTSPYDFNSIPISILGSIYERFLGKVVVTTDKRAKVVEKPEVRKAGGVFYTPEYIVRYIVGETVGKLIEGKTPDQIKKLRFADIACGSGSFLLEVYNRLLEYHTRYYSEHPEKAKKGDIEKREGKIVLSHKKRQEILVNNINGVDIDPQATEVTQLSLYLKLMEDVTMNDAYQFSLLKERMLPDLKRNIVCGNSLVARDILGGELFDNRDEQILKPMNFEDTFPNTMQNGGFDCVVGNPPYLGGREWKAENGRQYAYFVEAYEVAEYQFDMYVLFIEKSFRLVKQGGLVGYITPNTWLNNQSNLKLRAYLLSHSRVRSITDYTRMRVFKQAVVLPIVTIFEKGGSTDDATEIRIPEVDHVRLSHKIDQSVWSADGYKIINIDLHEGDTLLRTKIESNHPRLDTLALVKFGIKLYETGKGIPPQQPTDAANHVFESERKISHSYRRYLEGKDIVAYQINWKERWLKYGENLAAPRDPNLFEGERLLLRRIVGERLIGTYTNEDFVTSQLLQIVKPSDRRMPKYVLAILNSSMMAFYFRKKYNRRDKTFPEIRIYELASLPIRTIAFDLRAELSEHEHVVSLVDQMLLAKEHRTLATTGAEQDRLDIRIESLDRQIDIAVYELYGLTDSEIKIVEGGDEQPQRPKGLV